MQATGYLPTIRRSGVQVLIIVAVAAMGVGFGRWVVPTVDSGSTVVGPTRSEPSVTVRSEAISGLKLAQMDARDAAYGTPSVLTASAPKDRGIVQLKLAQMDARDAAFEPAASHATAAEQTRIGLKFAQMDAQDRRATAVAGVTVSPSAENHIVQLKLAQMDAQDAR